MKLTMIYNSKVILASRILIQVNNLQSTNSLPEQLLPTVTLITYERQPISKKFDFLSCYPLIQLEKSLPSLYSGNTMPSPFLGPARSEFPKNRQKGGHRQINTQGTIYLLWHFFLVPSKFIEPYGATLDRSREAKEITGNKVIDKTEQFWS